jgi:hypothetical protein
LNFMAFSTCSLFMCGFKGIWLDCGTPLRNGYQLTYFSNNQAKKN